MEASELRIGNFVSCGYIGVRKVVAVMTDRVQLDVDESVCGWWGHAAILQPIPLTDEVLEACGFEKREEYFRLLIGDEYGDIYLVPLKDKEFGIGEYNQDRDRLEILTHTIPCAALHQIQNLYHALTGNELPIDETKLKQAIANEDK